MRDGSIFRTLREKAGLSQHQAAEKSGVSQSAISSYESGRSIPTLDNVSRLSEAYNVPIAAFDTRKKGR